VDHSIFDQTALPNGREAWNPQIGSSFRICLPSGVIVAAFAVLLLVWPQSVQAAPPTPGPFCRFGITLWQLVEVQNFDLGRLNASWYVDYYSPGISHAPGFDYAPILQLHQDGVDGYRMGMTWRKLDVLLDNNPHALLMIGNEPDRRFLQDDMAPAAYAVAYHDIYNYVKHRHPGVQVLAGNLVQPTPIRLQYLDLVLAAYQERYGQQMPVDSWSIHNFLLNERSCIVYPNDCWGADIPPGVNVPEGLVLGINEADRIDLFVANVVRFRRWMAENGYRDRPLYITEMGILVPPSYGYPPERVNAFMQKAFDYLLAAKDPNLGYVYDGNHLVQRFAWYAVIEPRFNGGLFEGTNQAEPVSPPYVMSLIGQAYEAYTSVMTPTSEIRVVSALVMPPPRAPIGMNNTENGNEITATLTVRLGNSGNLLAPSEAQVTVYDGIPTASNQPVAAAQLVTLSGCGTTAELQFQWHSARDGAENGFLSLVVQWSDSTIIHKIPYFAIGTQVFVPFVSTQSMRESNN
jgi:hypothetical protein